MNNNTKKSHILRSNTINKRKVEEIIIQLKNIPAFWKEKFIQDDWQLLLTDNMPQKFGGRFEWIYAYGNKRQLWLNIGALDIHSNIIYIAFAYYVSMEYAQIDESTIFAELTNRNEQELKLFLKSRGDSSWNKSTIFAELFSFVIETNGKNPLLQINESYQYVKKWVYGQIFERDLAYIPNYIEVGVDVIDEKIETVNKAFKLLPQRLQQMFWKEGWKIRVSNEKIIGDRIYGFYSVVDRKIFIRSSSPKLIRTVWHEFGHYLDAKECFISNKSFFITAYKNERMNIKVFYDDNEEFEYAISNNVEYFADVFSLYMINPNKLQKYVPKSYNVINNVLRKWR